MALASNEIKQQQSIAMIHDIDNVLTRLNQVKVNLLNSVTDLLNFASTLDPDSPEMKTIERRRQQLAAYEKKIDGEIQAYKNRKKFAETVLNTSSQNVEKAIARMSRA